MQKYAKVNFPGKIWLIKYSLIIQFKQNQQQNIIIMSRNTSKQNWFQSPHIKSGFWFFHQQKNDLFNLSKSLVGDQNITFTPSRIHRPIDIQKNRNTPSHQFSETDQSRFDDVKLPDMFTNTKIQKLVINQKLTFEDSSIIQEEDDYLTPERDNLDSDGNSIKGNKYLQDTTAKKNSFHYLQEKKTRPKQKGLRVLSQKAYEIVLKMNGATYKQVANVLVDQLATQDNIEIDAKDQQNIKRRVYDALNVLIALGVLRKNGRKIYGVDKNNLQQQQQIKEIKIVTNQLELKKHQLIEKIKQRKSIQTNLQMIKALIKRNKSVQKTPKQNKINFPFIAVCVSQADQQTIDSKPASFQILISQQVIQPFGDIDTVSFLKRSLKAFIE